MSSTQLANKPSTALVYIFLLLWQAPLGACSAKRRHYSPEWTILSHINCFIQGEVVVLQILLDSLHPHSTRASWWSPPVLQGAAVKIFLASVSSGIWTMWPNREKHRVWTIAERLVVCLTSSFNTWCSHGVSIWFLGYMQRGKLVYTAQRENWLIYILGLCCSRRLSPT